MSGALPLLINDEHEVVSGNLWLEAAVLAGCLEAPVIRVGHLSKVEQDILMLALARITERGEWDQTKLKAVFAELDLVADNLDFELSLTGFDLPEIDAHLVAPDEVPNEVLPRVEVEAVSCLGDVWLLGEHRIACGDATKPETVEALLGSDRVDAAVADFPYNKPSDAVSGFGATQHPDFAMGAGEITEEEFVAFMVLVMSLMARFSRKGAVHVCAIDWASDFAMQTAGRSVYEKLLNICVWVKDRDGMGGFYRSQHEFMQIWRVKGARHKNNVKLGRFGRDRSNCWSYASANTFGRRGEEGDLAKTHPTVKNLQMIADALMDITDRGELVLDPFLGSGTTLIACEKTRRRCRAIEISPHYVDVAIRRWERWTGEEARLQGCGRTFTELQRERLAEAGV
ncbi:DNA modification methylase [soil metagenome]